MAAPSKSSGNGMNARIATIISVLVAAAIGSAIVLYREVGTLSRDVGALQKEMDRLLGIERIAFGRAERLDERVQELEEEIEKPRR